MRTYPLKSAVSMIAGLLIVISTGFVSARVSAQEQSKETYFVQHQAGANQGYYALGLGYRHDRFEHSYSIGYTPPIKSGARVTQGNIKLNFRILDGAGPQIQWLAGASLFVNASSRTFFEAPQKYPNKYYPPNAYYFALNTTIRHHGFFVEASILDYFLEVAARNEHSFDLLTELVSVGFGYNQDVDFEWSDVTDTVGSWF